MAAAYNAQRTGQYVKNFVRKPNRKRPPEILKHRWKGNIKMDFNETKCGGVD
jgi:hypothetical protein